MPAANPAKLLVNVNSVGELVWLRATTAETFFPAPSGIVFSVNGVLVHGVSELATLTATA